MLIRILEITPPRDTIHRVLVCESIALKTAAIAQAKNYRVKFMHGRLLVHNSAEEAIAAIADWPD